MIAAAGLDLLLGDPRWCPHPVVWMGRCITSLRRCVEGLAGDHRLGLRLSGGLITLLLVLGSGICGWALERLVLPGSPLPWPWAAAVLVVALASALAARSLRDSVLAVVDALPDLVAARRSLAWIVGRDTEALDQEEILRAAAETASENAVDGLFAPLFWMLLGAALWQWGATAGPGPLALAWAFKASSTLDSMLGYRRGRLQWLGTAGARLDDALTWLPCRLVLLTLPLVSRPWSDWFRLVQSAERDGAADPSPNAGRSQAIYAHCSGVQLGGTNRYGERQIAKPVLATGQPPVDATAVRRILNLSARLELLWLLLALGASNALLR